MKRFWSLLFRSFLLFFAVFSFISAMIMYFAYSQNYKFDPYKRESNVLVVGIDKGKQRVISAAMINFDPDKKELSLLAFPDCTLLENAEIFQDSYYEKGISYLEKRAGEITGTSISRYIVLDSEKICQIVNAVNEFPYAVNYPFEYEGQYISGTIMLDGEKASAMLSYEGYDRKTTSVSGMSLSLFQALLSEVSDKESDEIKNILSTDEFCKSEFTNMSEKELSEYISLLSEYNAMDHKITEIVGETNIVSERAYFIPKKLKADKNIFD